ncbi:MAG TPA: YihY/virulence factor BrkB family protein [Bryobacteraceae bacterium]|nr:YihY/virulence factor BrkB family protein [Bryobacteraceae bacterium]
MDAPAVLPRSLIRRMLDDVRRSMAELRADLPALGRYLIEPEAHVYAFSIAANVLLSFFPFMLVMIAICRHLLDWPAAELSLYIAIRDYFPGSTGQFLAYNLKVAADNSRRLEWVSMLLLLFTANGIFLPLEVALNKAWGVKVNRSLLKNQAVSMLLIFGCGFLVMLSAAVSGLGPVLWSGMSGQSLDAMRSTLTDRWQLNWAPMPLVGVLKLTTIPSTLLILFLVFWLLPNTKVPWRAIVPRAVVIGLFLEALKWVNLLIWPWVYAKFSREFGVFNNSVTILTWSLFAALVVLAGADWTARSVRRSIEVEKEPGGGLAQSE